MNTPATTGALAGSTGRGRSTRAVLRPSGLTVLYDATCPVCRQARRWVERQQHLVPVRFIAAGSPAAGARFPRLDAGSTLADVTVVTDDGAVLRGDRAWIAVLWSVARTRRTAVQLANGRRRWMFRNVKGATDAIRRLSAGQADIAHLTEVPYRSVGRPGWPAPSPTDSQLDSICDATCRNFRT